MINSGLAIIDNNGGLIPGKIYCLTGDKKVGKTTILTCLHHKYKCTIVCNDSNEYDTPLIIDTDKFKPEYLTDFIYKPDNKISKEKLISKVIEKIKLILETDIKPILIVDIKLDILKEVMDIAKKYDIIVLIAINSAISIPNELQNEIIKIEFIKNDKFIRKIKFKNEEEIIQFDFIQNNLKKA